MDVCGRHMHLGRRLPAVRGGLMSLLGALSGLIRPFLRGRQVLDATAAFDPPLHLIVTVAHLLRALSRPFGPLARLLGALAPAYAEPRRQFPRLVQLLY